MVRCMARLSLSRASSGRSSSSATRHSALDYAACASRLGHASHASRAPSVPARDSTRPTNASTDEQKCEADIRAGIAAILSNADALRRVSDAILKAAPTTAAAAAAYGRVKEELRTLIDSNRTTCARVAEQLKALRAEVERASLPSHDPSHDPSHGPSCDPREPLVGRLRRAQSLRVHQFRHRALASSFSDALASVERYAADRT